MCTEHLRQRCCLDAVLLLANRPISRFGNRFFLPFPGVAMRDEGADDDYDTYYDNEGICVPFLTRFYQHYIFVL